MKRILAMSHSLIILIIASTSVQAFDFQSQLFDPPTTILVWVVDINPQTGEVNLNGVDTQGPGTPFTWDWGDGTIHDGWFPQQHTYTDVTRNHIVKVTAHYHGGGVDSAETIVRFVSPTPTPISLPADIAVTIPHRPVKLTGRLPGYRFSDRLTSFDDSDFNIISRSTLEYILTVAASIQKSFVNDDVFQTNSSFEQILLRDPSFSGMYALWYTSPVAIGTGELQQTIQYTSLFHEMGHNFTLNTPSDYHYGGKIDGNANAIFSESLAQIFQHATAYEIINNADTYGLGEDIVFDIRQSAVSSILVMRSAYEDYRADMRFSSWNDSNTPEDDTFGTFMTIAHKFCVHAETSGLGYKVPLKRMMEFLQYFDENLRQRYDQHNNTAEADTFRATFMVTALSYAFSTDLRAEFRDLEFPISDQTFGELYSRAETDSSVLPFTRITFSPVEGVSPGEEFTLDIIVEGVTNLAGLQLDLLFNKDVLQATQVIEGDFLKQGGAGTFWQAGDIDNTKGTISGVVSTSLGTGGITGAGTLLTITFKANSSGESLLELQNLKLGDASGETISSLALPGKIHVVFARWDVNQDGIVDIFDLILVSQHFGQQAPQNPGVDVKADGIVDIFDLITVAQHFGESTSGVAPAAPQMPDTQDATMLQRWLIEARISDDGTEIFQRGMAVLEHLLSLMIPEQTVLLANYPNPFNPETWIPYQLAEEAFVTLTIYNMMGQVVRTINIGHQSPAMYLSKEKAIYFDGRNDTGEPVASNVYFYMLKAGNYTATRKMVILK